MRRFPRPALALVAALLVAASGCGGPSATPEVVWGRRGVQPGDIVRPRAAVIDHEDRLFVVDFTARVQAFDLDGHHLGVTFRTPDFRNGRPSGLSIDRDGNLIVSDSHYHCFRIYAADGTALKKLGGKAGTEPGQLGYVSDVVQDDEGFWYVAEFGEVQRISKLDAAGKVLKRWGAEGSDEGQFSRARALALGPDGLLYVADACSEDRSHPAAARLRALAFRDLDGALRGCMREKMDYVAEDGGWLHPLAQKAWNSLNG